MNPVILFEVPGEINVTFRVVSGDTYFSRVELQLGESVGFEVTENVLHSGDYPRVAMNVIFIVCDDVGNVVWNESLGEFGGGWMLNAGSAGISTCWFPDKTGTYSAGVVFEGTDYPNNFLNIMQFRVLEPGQFMGKVTGMDQETPLPDASVAIIQDGEVKANLTTDIGGGFALSPDRAGIYDVRVSAQGYIASVRKGVSTKIETVPLDFSLVPSEYASTFEAIWNTSVADGSDVAVDGQNNILTVSGWESTTVSKFDTDGNSLWSVKKQLSGGWEHPCGVAVDASDNILVVVTAQQNGSDNLGIAKLDPSGNLLWACIYDSGDYDTAMDVTVDSKSNVVVAGNVQIGGRDPLAVVKYDSAGNLLWSTILQAYMWTGEATIDKDDNIVVCGLASSSSDGIAYYVAKIAPEGDLLWEQTLKREEIAFANCYAIAADLDGNILVAGDQFTAKLNPNGNILWLRYNFGADMALDSKGNIVTIFGSSLATYTPDGLFLGDEAIPYEPYHMVSDENGDIIVIGWQDLAKLRCEFHNPIAPNSTSQSDTLKLALTITPFTLILPLLTISAHKMGIIRKIKARFALVKKP